MNEETKELMACFNSQFEVLMSLYICISEIDREVIFDGVCNDYAYSFIKAEYNRRRYTMQARNLIMDEQEKKAWEGILERYKK